MTIGEIEKLARINLLDTYEDSYRFSPYEIFQAIRDGVDRTRSLRPESKYVNGILTAFEFPDILDSFTAQDLASLRSSRITIDDRWRQAIVLYVVYAMYLKDDADTTNQQLAANYLQQYTVAVNS